MTLAPEHHPSRERMLWTAVLGEQLNLALREKDPMNLGDDPARARRWIGSASFRDVCHLASIDPEWVLRKYRQQLALPVDGRWLTQVGLRSVTSGLTETKHPRTAFQGAAQ